MRKLLTFFMLPAFLLWSPAARSQNDPGPVSPDSLFDRVFDMYGNTYSLRDIAIDTNARVVGGMSVQSQLLCTSSGYFNIYFETGSGFEQNTALHIARRAVICQLFQDISNFIVPVNSANKVNIWVRDISNVLNTSPSTSGVLGLASSFYTVPTGAPNVSGIVDGEIWKTINSGYDSYTNTVSPLISTGAGPNLGFYHGIMAFNVYNSNINWHLDMTQPTAAGLYDLYTVALHEVTHALGFASLIDFNGLSKMGANYPYYTRYDMFLKAPLTLGGQNLITNIGGCSLYNFGFNPSLTAFSLLSPNPPACGNVIPYGGVLDATNCNLAARFVGSVIDEKVYTPDCFEPPSSLSHLEDQCAYGNNLYFNMSNASNTGVLYMKRYPKAQERQVLCDIGYRVNTTYGNALYSANNFNYGGQQCPGLWTAGINDGINSNGTFTWVTTSNVAVSFTGANILANDNATDFDCMQDVYGNGALSVIGTGSAAAITYTPAAAFTGTALLRYIPKNGSNRGNITYVYIRVNSANCVASPCNMVMNGEFESTAGSCGSIQTAAAQVDCWSNYSSSADLFARNCNAWLSYYNIPNSAYSNPVSDTWNNGANNNDHFIGLFGQYDGATWDEESIQTLLTTPIVASNTYTIGFWAKVANWGQFASGNIPANIAICGSVNQLAPVWLNYDINNPALTQLVPSIVVPATSSPYQWQYFTQTFTYTSGPNLNNLIIGYDATVTSHPSTRYVYIDAVTLVPAGTTPTFNPPAASICIGSVLSNLEQFVNPTGGTFSGAGVYFNTTTNQWDFSQTAAGTYNITYTYVDNSGCTTTAIAPVTVNSFNAPVISVNASPGTSVCQYSTVTLNASGALTYTWSPGISCTAPCATGTINPAATTTYTVTGTDANGCTGTNWIIINVTTPNICCATPTVIVPTGALASATSIPFGAVVEVQGTFIIDVNVTYVFCYFRMRSGSRIIVNSGRSMYCNFCHFFSCSKMWDGIYLMQSGTSAATLVIDNSSVEDADNGIVADCNNTVYGSVINLSNTVFNKNNYSLQVFNHITTAYPLDIRNCKFTCRSSPLSFGNGLKFPHTNERSYAAVFIKNVDKITVGNTGSAAVADSFINHDYGVYVLNSNTSVYNCTFYDMPAPTPACPPSGCPPPLGVAIFVPDNSQTGRTITVGGTGAFEPNQFVEVRTGVNARNVGQLSVLNNRFLCSTTPLSWLLGSHAAEFGVTAQDIRNWFEVRDNIMTNFATSIQLRRNSTVSTSYNPNIYVISNHVSVTGTGYVSRGVELMDMSGNTTTAQVPIEVFDNHLLNIRNFGIRCTYFRNKPHFSGTSTVSQAIFMRYAPSAISYGIYLQGCDSPVVCNNAINSSNKGSTGMHGIYLNDTRNARVQCNQVFGIGNCITVSGGCTGPYTAPGYRCGIITNTFWNAQVGVGLINAGQVGQQGDATHPGGNVWFGAANGYNLGQTRTDASSIPANSIFYCRNTVLTEWPTIHTTIGTGIAYANGSTILNGVGTPPACPTASFLAPPEGGEEEDPDGEPFHELGLKEEQGLKTGGIRVYPNPAGDWVNIVTPEPAGRLDVTVTDMIGRTWPGSSLSPDGNTYKMETKNLPAGLYILKISAVGQVPQFIHLQITH